MAKVYLQLEFGSGKFYQYSKKRKEDFEEHENGSFRKYYDDGVGGILQSVSIRENPKLNVEEVSIVLKEGGDLYYLPVQLYNQKGQISTYAESLIAFLPKLKKGDDIDIRGYNFVPEDFKYKKIGFSVQVDGEKITKGVTFAYYDREGNFVDGDVPALEWEEKRGKNRPTAASLEKKDDYLYEVLEEAAEELKYEASERTSSNRTNRTKRKPKEEVSQEETTNGKPEAESKEEVSQEEADTTETVKPKQRGKKKDAAKKETTSRTSRKKKEAEVEETEEKKPVEADGDAWKDDLPF